MMSFIKVQNLRRAWQGWDFMVIALLVMVVVALTSTIALAEYTGGSGDGYAMAEGTGLAIDEPGPVQPVPELTTIVLISLGLAALVVYLWLRRRKAVAIAAILILIGAGTLVPFSQLSHVAQANNASLSNVNLAGLNAAEDYTHIQFDLSWENSWRDANNWDAVWVFAKYKVTDAGSGSGTPDGKWRHCTLATSGHIINSATPSEMANNASAIHNPGDNATTGVFIHRTQNGTGTVTLTYANIRWMYGADTVDGTNAIADDATVTVKVFAIETVYVPQGTLNLNTLPSSNMTNEFFNDGGSTVQITSENALSEGAIRWKKNDENGGTGNDNGTSYGSDALGASYPKGYAAFYCMKYEYSQGQYADFLNTLTSTQASNRYPNHNGDYRHTISESGGVYSASKPARACNYITWMDGCAYADWAGLRPITELEFEKSCRGNQSVVTDEFAWGTGNIVEWGALTISGTEDGTETITTDVSDGACCYNNKEHSGGDGGFGPLRCGIFAESATTRITSGAGYYGVMELSGNVYERCVTIADRDNSGSVTNAGLFNGSHGDGSLSTNGHATNSTWPGESGGEVTGAVGAGFRGGSWANTTSVERVSARNAAGYTMTGQSKDHGFRAVRSS